MPRGKKKFALIWWIEFHQKDVIALSLIPKNLQKVDSIVDLTWKNYQTKVDTKADAKVLAISVIKRDIQYQEQLLDSMKRAYESQQKMNVDFVDLFPVPNCYFEAGDDKHEIATNCGVYLSKIRHKYIEDYSILNNDWKILVRETLLEVYGQSIANYSATGKRTTRPGIDCRLFKGIQDWINRTILEPVSKADLIDFINKLASNKRKYRSVASKDSKKKKVPEDSAGLSKNQEIK